jgi:hypothetical protein
VRTLALYGFIAVVLSACEQYNGDGPRKVCLKGHDQAAAGNWGAAVLFVCDDWRISKDQSASGDTK